MLSMQEWMSLMDQANSGNSKGPCAASMPSRGTVPTADAKTHAEDRGDDHRRLLPQFGPTLAKAFAMGVPLPESVVSKLVSDLGKRYDDDHNQQ